MKERMKQREREKPEIFELIRWVLLGIYILPFSSPFFSFCRSIVNGKKKKAQCRSMARNEWSGERKTIDRSIQHGWIVAIAFAETGIFTILTILNFHFVRNYVINGFVSNLWSLLHNITAFESWLSFWKFNQSNRKTMTLAN